jgi:hypothetical protein
MTEDEYEALAAKYLTALANRETPLSDMRKRCAGSSSGAKRIRCACFQSRTGSELLTC